MQIAGSMSAGRRHGYSGLRVRNKPSCVLVVIGVNERLGPEAFPGDRRRCGNPQTFAEVLLKLKRGMNVPKLAIGDGAMGFWAALEEIYPETRQQRCWMHKVMNVLNCLPKSVQARRNRPCTRSGRPRRRRPRRREGIRLALKPMNRSIRKPHSACRNDREELLAFYRLSGQALAEHQNDESH